MEEREWGARPARAGSPASPPSPRLDVSSYSFDPLLALYSPRLPPIPYPNAPCFNNVAEYESFLKGGRTGRGRARGTGEPASAGTSRRRAAPTPDPERIQRLRRLMVVKEDADGTAGARRQGPGRSKPSLVSVHEGSPLGELHRCIREGVKVNVHIRTFKGLRGVCTGFLVAFDKFWNMALTDVDETYRKPVLGKAYERDSSLTLTRLFDRLKLQDSSKKEGARAPSPPPCRHLRGRGPGLSCQGGLHGQRGPVREAPFPGPPPFHGAHPEKKRESPRWITSRYSRDT
ncbi:U7 snRNA-associated Sm-like protein LSm11 [Lemmus lemmus]